VEQISSNLRKSLAPENFTSDLLHKLEPFLKRGEELTLIDGLPSAPFSKNTSGRRANAYYFGHPLRFARARQSGLEPTHAALRLMNRGGHSREGDEQTWAEQTEIHHRPGQGITAEMLQGALRPLGFSLKLYPHNNKVGAEVIRGERGRVPLRMRIAQRLSGIDPNSEAGAITLLCVAERVEPPLSSLGTPLTCGV
jgi:hypothetical protein